MDLYAFMFNDALKELLPSEPPRLRGIRLMKIQDEIDDDSSSSSSAELFNSFCGKDVIYIHTRCGQCYFSSDDNYIAFGMDEWESENNAIGAANDPYDCTYRDTYIEVTEDKKSLYDKILADFDKTIEDVKVTMDDERPELETK